MKRKTLPAAVRALPVILLASGSYALAEDRGPEHLSGLFNDYTTVNSLGAPVSGGPYEMHGRWSMVLHRERGTADFFADMTMNSYVTVSGVPNPTQALNPHTHHVKLTEIAVSTDTSLCPTYKTATTMRFQITGPLSLLTGNGNVLSGETDPPTSSLQVCVSGGPLVEYSNITLVFSYPANGHFGVGAIHGVVNKASHDRDESHDWYSNR